jgi:pilus assembly protein FimV
MKKLKRVSAFVFAGMALMSASGSGHALGFGRPFSRAVLGDTLSVTVPLRLDAGEEISDECLAADVFFGDDKVLASAIRTVVQTGEGGERVLKVSTTALINEPVVTVYLAAGCKARMTRKFVAFADPPGIVMPSVEEATPANVAVIDERAEKPARGAGSRRASARGASASAKSARAGGGSRPDLSGVEASGSSDTPTMSARAARILPTDQSDASDGSAGSRSALRSASTLAPARAEEGGGGRLVLDSAPTDLPALTDLRMTSSLGVMLQADDQSPEVLARRRTAAALWQALNATPEEMARDRQRLSELEQRLTQLTAENQRNRQALTEAQSAGGSSKWLALLALIAIGAVGVAVYLARRLKSAGKGGQDAWWHSQTDSRLKEPASEETPSNGERTSAFVRPSSAAGADASVRSRVEPSGVAAATAKTPVRANAPAASTAPSVLTPAPSKQTLHELVPDAAGVSALATSAPAVLASRSAEPLREVSVEELIDLEQQAEFFVVLGQDDAAIGLLESHVTNTTGASPLPFLKLLEIYRRLGRRSDYERVQSQFNLRFNAHAPSWESDLQQEGHSLDEYPGVVERLQSLWATPAKAMEVLEKSLTRPDASADTFELPAYRELLFLYAVARDLSEREPHERANIDLLLPSLDGDVDEGEPTVPLGGPELEPLMVTRPIKAQPEALPSMNLDFHLDDLSEPTDMTTKH